MNNHVNSQEYWRKRTERELEEFEQRLQERREHLYRDLKNLNKGKKEYEERMRYLERHENYFRNQERRLLLVAAIALTLLLLWFLYLSFGGANLGEMIWVTSVATLGILLATMLTIYLLEKAGLKEQSEKMILRVLFHLAMSPVYFLRMIWFGARKVFERLLKKQGINRY